MAPASSPVASSRQRRPAAAVTSARPTPGKGRPQPRLRLADAGDGVCAPNQPVVEDRLLESCLVVVVRGEPVAALAHLARGLGIERLVGIADGRTPEPGQKCHAAEQQEKQGRAPHNLSIVYWTREPPSAMSSSTPRPPGRRDRRVHRSPQVRQQGGACVPAPGIRRRARSIRTQRQVEGLQAYPSVLDVPGPIDMATIYVPPETGLAVIEEIARKGIPEVWLNPGAESPALVAARARAWALRPSRPAASSASARHRRILDTSESRLLY